MNILRNLISATCCMSLVACAQVTDKDTGQTNQHAANNSTSVVNEKKNYSTCNTSNPHYPPVDPKGKEPTLLIKVLGYAFISDLKV